MSKEELKEIRFLTKKQSAQYLNVDIGVLNQLIETGHLPIAKIGKRTYRIDVLDIEKCLADIKHTK
ncbi:helix-turn-helix domain-containing protein [Jeotgalibaca porci]|uniref:helix-turn-helix domain-containing protein n=1 Tax=Jeotgalibaca porci TaxID=1868793 RepID=UPI003F921BAC